MTRFDAASTTRRDVERVDDLTLQAARPLPTATLHEAGGKIGALPSAIRAIAPGMRCCGSALTVHAPPGDNLWLHRALDIAQPGDVLVVFTSGAHEHGYWGEIMASMAQARCVAGLVIDACVRDGASLAEMGFAVFARGLCIRGTGKDFSAIGWINHPVWMGEVVVHAGDLIACDGDGVVALPRQEAASIVARARQREAAEIDLVQRLKDGASTMDLYGWR